MAGLYWLIFSRRPTSDDAYDWWWVVICGGFRQEKVWTAFTVKLFVIVYKHQHYHWMWSSNNHKNTPHAQIQPSKQPSRANLSCGIKNAKRSYAKKINDHFTDSRDTQSLWQAIQTITDYKPPPQACDDDTSLPDALNHFYSRFEM